MSEIIKDYTNFRRCSPYFIKKVKLFYVSKFSKNYFAYYVLSDYQVYGFGDNIFKILGYKSNNNINEDHVLIKEICDQDIKEFYQGENFMFAKNIKSQIFSWGINENGQLGRGFDSGFPEYFKPSISEYLVGKNILYISCGERHCFALSLHGVIYGWGSNDKGQIGCGYKKKVVVFPVKIKMNEKFKFIHCVRNITFAVNFGGKAFYWGQFDINNPIFIPKLIPLENVSKVYDYHNEIFIILNKNGQVFEFNVINRLIKEIILGERFIDVYSDNFYTDCLLKTVNCVYKMNYQEILFKTNYYNFSNFNFENSRNFKKAIEITAEGYLVTKEIHLNEVGQILFLNDENIIQNYENIFEHIEDLGCGTIGQVFKVKQKSNNKFYAIKKVLMNDNSDSNEIEIMSKLSKLNSPFVVKYIRSWTEKIKRNVVKNYLFIQMELCSNNLRELIDIMNFEYNFQIFHYFISSELFKELIECVNYLHSLKPPIIHRDLKPENIVISWKINNGRLLKLCDFELAKFHEISNHTRGLGTMNYMAPEVKYSINYNTKSDIYSLALIATELFKFEDRVGDIRKHTNPQDFEKYSLKYLDTNLKKNFKQLLETLQNCLLPEDYHLRPSCSDLFKSIYNICINKDIVLNDKNFQDFQSFLQDEEILKRIFNGKISS